MDDERDDERTAPPYEFGGGESSGDDDAGSGDDESGDDERDAPAYEFSGGESSGEDDDEADDDSENQLPAEERMADEDSEPTGEPGGERTAPAYEFGEGESSGDDDAPLEGGVRRGAREYEFGEGESSGEEDEEESVPATAATKTPHGDFTAKHRAERERAKAEREAKAEAERTRDRRKRRLRTLGIALGAAALIVIVAVVISSGGGSATKKGGEQSGPAVGASAVNKRFDGIPQSGFVLGDPKAPVTLVEFADLQCPFCKQAADNSLPTLVDKYVRPGKVRIEFRNFAILGPDSEKAARAAAGAAAQNKAWQFIDLWYLNQGEENSGYVTDGFISKIASGVQGLDPAKVVAAANDPKNNQSVDKARADAQTFGIDSTPSFLIGRTGQPLQQLQLQDPSDPNLFGQAIDRQLGQQ